MAHDLSIWGGTLATATETYCADIGIRDRRIVTIAEEITDADDVVGATDRLVLPGGIEAHWHIAQESGMDVMTSDDCQSGSISAAFGGNPCFVPFAAQKQGESLAKTLETYDERAVPKSFLDWSYHLILTDPTPEVLAELPQVFAKGVTSFKVFMNYATRVSDAQFLDILSVTGKHRALTMVHGRKSRHARLDGPSHGRWRQYCPAISHPSRPGLVEEEAINRAISLARLAEAPLFIIHVSTPVGAKLIADARQRRPGLGRDLPAVPVPDPRRSGQAGDGRRQVHLLAAIARHAHAKRALAACTGRYAVVGIFRQRPLSL